MPETKYEKGTFILMNDCILIHSIGEVKKIKIPNSGSYIERKQWLDNDNIVLDIGKNVSGVKIGDNLVLAPLVKTRGIDKLTTIMQEKLGKQIVDVDILDRQGKPTGLHEDTEKYFIVKEEDIICKIN